jgi:hypothetical protein
MRYTDSRKLIDRGRKAGLRTAELYNALAGRRLGQGDHIPGENDGNGFVSEFNGLGQLVFHPVNQRPG